MQFGRALRQARRRHGLSLRGLQGLVLYDFTYLGQVERGEKPGSLALATGCDEALSAGGSLIEVFRVGEAAGSDTPSTMVAGREASSPGLEDLRSLYHGTYSIDELFRSVVDHLTRSAERLDGARGELARRRLLIERADAALLAGRLALFDTWVPLTARGYLATAAEAAVEAGDHALAAGAFGHLAFVSARERLPRAGLGYVRLARRHASRAGVPALVSWVAAVEAEIGEPLHPHGGLACLDAAVRALETRPEAPVPTWFDFYSPGRLEGFRGRALLAAGRGDPAREALTVALARLETDAVKQRAVLLADLAASHLCDPAPDVEEAAVHALRAATELGRTQYGAAAERLAVLRTRLEPWSARAAVRRLDDLLAERRTSIGA